MVMTFREVDKEFGLSRYNLYSAVKAGFIKPPITTSDKRQSRKLWNRDDLLKWLSGGRANG